MTAVIGILNKHAVAIAADSAVTVSGNKRRKIFNYANKIFALTKYHPVGVMLYNSAEMMGIPWETIIKVYRRELKDKSFSTLEEYQNDFINFLVQKNFFLTDDDQQTAICNWFVAIIQSIIKRIFSDYKELQDRTDENVQKLLIIIQQQVNKDISLIEQNKSICPHLANYTLQDFASDIQKPFQEVLSYFSSRKIDFSTELQESLKKLFHLIFTRQGTVSNYTGLIFVGYGENEIFPRLLPIRTSIAIGKRLHYFIETDKRIEIGTDCSVSVSPFAQTDVIDTILSGVAPALENYFILNFQELLEKFHDDLAGQLQAYSSDIANALNTVKASNVERMVEQLRQKNLEAKMNNYVVHLMNAVHSLAKEDLAEMAESLIHLTYLKRRISSDEESVGGPIDVALISKGDGFIWIKRKHYFKPELNKQFFDNYYRE